MKQLIERKQYMQTLLEWKDLNIIKVITGVWRCGKSTLLQMFADELLQDGVTEEQIQFYNFEDFDTHSLVTWKDVYNYIKVRLIPDKINYVFLYEVQKIADFYRLVGGIFSKKNVDLYLIGSNARIFLDELKTWLMEKYIQIPIFPMQFAEYYDFITLKFPKASKMECLEKFIMEGGVPEYLNRKNTGQKQANDFMRDALISIVKKDVYGGLNSKNKCNFHEVVNYVFDYVGSLISPHSISKSLRINNGAIVKCKTAAKYLDALCNAFLFYKVPQIEMKSKKIHLPVVNKYYLVDPCFRKVRLWRNMEDERSMWLENLVYFELLRTNKDVYIGLINNKEIDFVATDYNDCTSYYQVSWSTENEDYLKRELASLRAINDSNPKYLLTMDIDSNPVYGDIRKLNVADWLLDKQ
jgi:predicted AAA+ superfamily ATPase